MESLKSQVCSRCNAEKPISEFTKRPRAKSGYSSVCKACSAEKYRATSAKRKCLAPPQLERNPVYSDVNDAELIAKMRSIVSELKARGFIYQGELKYVRTIKL